MSDIVKVCEIHGDLTKEQCIIEKLKTGPYHRCRLCRNNRRFFNAMKGIICKIHGIILKEELITTQGNCRLCSRENASKNRNKDRALYNERIRQYRVHNPYYAKRQLKYGGLYSLSQCCRIRGITIQDYQNMHDDQNANCAICLKPETRRHKTTKKPGRLTIDHCHKTNEVRGLLCHNCNTGVGKFSDDPEIMLRAIRYIKQGGFFS